MCTLEDIISTASFLLRDLGVFYMVNRPERLADAIELMRKYKIEPKKIKFVLPYENKKPNLFLISGSKFGNQFLDVEEPLIIRKSNGDYTEKLYGIYSEKEE
ncbi:MAG: SAM-dependent methyltransferase, partial [Clostridia bacterium]|nr:SAM-dependent methyltransferase [Clostridia bacterium]